MKDSGFTNSFIIADLIKRQIQGEPLTESEKITLSNWRSENIQNEQLLERLENPRKLAQAVIEMDQTDTDSHLERFNILINRKKRTQRLFRFASVAAIIALILSVGLYLFTRPNKTQISNPALASKYGGEALPATNKATLSISSGNSFELSETQNGVVLRNGNISYEDGQLIVDVAKNQDAILTTPRGGQYQVTLSDGSIVRLNAGSSLRYPLQFPEGERMVELYGEAYFDIRHQDTAPFIVKTLGQRVTVLGTTFNIKAYTAKEVTTLISGRVMVQDEAGRSIGELAPGSQAINEMGKIIVRKVNVDDYIGWKNGRFQADLTSLGEIIPEIERWYDVDFVLPPKFENNEKAFLSINRNEKLSTVLNTLELTFGVKFSVDGKEVHIR